VLITALPALLLLAWLIGRSGAYTSGSQVGYALGLCGGVMMLLLFLYPLRKHVRFMHAWGANRYWFAAHMLFGILGPLFILMHSTFRIGSLNAGVALATMLLVAGSGIVGRFIYTRLHHGLYGERARLQELQAQLKAESHALRASLPHAPAVEGLLAQFEAVALEPRGGLLAKAWRFLTLGLRASRFESRAMRELRSALRTAHRAQADPEQLARQAVRAKRAIRAYLASLQRIAQFSAYERMFSWWHVLHVPLVYMLVLSAIAHVVAVHIY